MIEENKIDSKKIPSLLDAANIEKKLSENDEKRIIELKQDLSSFTEAERESIWRDIYNLIQENLSEVKARRWGISSLPLTQPVRPETNFSQTIKGALTINESIRLDHIKKSNRLTAEEMSNLTNESSNLESAYLVKIAKKGYIGRVHEGRKSVYMLLEDAVREISKRMVTKSDELLTDEAVTRIADEIGSPNYSEVKQILTEMYREQTKP